MYIADKDRYASMPYRRAGKSGIRLPALSLGMWQNFGDQRPFDNSRKMMLRAFDLGINHFDLANNYGPAPGSAEETFGKVITADLKPYRDELMISTKAGHYMWPGPYGEWGSKKNLTASLDRSLRRMKLDYVDIFYSHRPDPITPLEETMDALAAAVHSGKALYAGISAYNPEMSARAIDILSGMGIHCLLHQPSYSMFNRWIEDGLQEVLDQKGVGSIVYCPLQQGLLSNRYVDGIPEDSRAGRPGGFLSREDVTPEKIEKVKALRQIAKERGQTVAQMALAWVLRGGRVTSAIIGASRLEQIEENILAVNNLDFSDDELLAIEAVLK